MLRGRYGFGLMIVGWLIIVVLLAFGIWAVAYFSQYSRDQLPAPSAVVL